MNCENTHPFPELEAGLLKLLQENSYQPETLAYFRKKLEALGLYMADHGINHYSPEVGEAFFDEHVRKNNYGVSSQKSLRTVIRRMNDYYHGNGFVLMPAKTELPLPSDYDRVLKLFADVCMERGNQPSTIKNKLYFCRTFCKSLACLGCGSVKEIDSEQISLACAMIKNKDGWAVIRELLRFLVKTGEIEKDFSLLVPSYRRGFHLPSTYSEEEIHRTEKAVDTTTVMGKRDYCIILLASRLGMRAGDIVRLSLENLDFKNEDDCDSDGNFLAEKGKSKSHDTGDIVSYMWAVSANDATPITYSVYRGGQVDSKSLQEMIASLTANGIQVSGVILDRGVSNVDSLKLLSGEGIPYVVMLKGNTNSHKNLVERYGKELRLNNVHYLIKSSGMYGVSEKLQVFSSDPMEAYVSLYYDS